MERASLEEVQRAYRDLVQVWHPDRFTSNERLQSKAQEQLKQFRRSLKTKDRKLAERLLSDLKAKIGALRISDDADLNFRQVANGNEFASAVPGGL